MQHSSGWCTFMKWCDHNDKVSRKEEPLSTFSKRLVPVPSSSGLSPTSYPNASHYRIVTNNLLQDILCFVCDLSEFNCPKKISSKLFFNRVVNVLEMFTSKAGNMHHSIQYRTILIKRKNNSTESWRDLELLDLLSINTENVTPSLRDYSSEKNQSWDNRYRTEFQFTI